MSLLIRAVVLFSCASKLAYGRPTCQLGPVGVSPIGSIIGIYLSCSNDLTCCAEDQVTGSAEVDTDPTLTPADGFGEDEYTAPPPLGNCSTASQYIDYSTVQCGTGQYKLCCDALTWTGASEQHAAVPPKSISACSTDWSYPCCCDDPSSSSSLSSPASILSPSPVVMTLTPALTPILSLMATAPTPAPGPGLSLAFDPALAPAPALGPEPELGLVQPLGPGLAVDPSPTISPAGPSKPARFQKPKTRSPVAALSPRLRGL
ncbi:hypothetical protein ABBQ38_006014 [Trebouxia sp. C0009 RCD-2024]